MTDRIALYFGCWGQLGHHLHDSQGKTFWDKKAFPNFPWSMGLMDTGLLRNGKRPDKYDGKVFWTCGGRTDHWFAFFWWDRSMDKRSGSNSGFYVKGFSFSEKAEAFEYAIRSFPNVVARQHHPLILQA